MAKLIRHRQPQSFAVGPIVAILVSICLAPSWLTLQAQEKDSGPKVPTQKKKGFVPSQVGAPSFQGGFAGPMNGPGMPFGGKGAARFEFTIDPKTPLKDLLPIVPKAKAKLGTIVDDVTQAPELAFEDPLQHNDGRAFEKTAHQIAKIHHVNQSKTDAFMEALFTQRDDLRGLPLVLGQACRTKVERSRLLSQAIETIRNALNQQISMPLSDARNAPQRAGEQFWMTYQLAVVKEDRANAAASKDTQEDLLLVRIAALMQVLGPETSALRKGLVKYLATLSHAEASKALAKLVIFSPEDDIRQAAIDALKVRRERDYTDVLLKGLRYPLPAVAERASEALVKLERSDFVPQLVAFLDEPDARAPFQGEVKGKKGTLVRELVRVNHHRNCLLCHAPAKLESLSGEFVTADMPIPGRPLPTPSQGYQSTIPDILVRIDVTYLRQDFSMMQPVAEAHPWPTEQRFDFLVRTRSLTDQEAKSFRSLFESRNPYRDAAWAALRKLTGRDLEPSSAAWRKELALRSQ